MTTKLWKTSDGVSLNTLAEEAEVSDLVEALDGERVEHYCVVHHCRAWGYPDVTECTFQRYQRANLGQPTETPCDVQPVVVVPLGEDA